MKNKMKTIEQSFKVNLIRTFMEHCTTGINDKPFVYLRNPNTKEIECYFIEVLK